MFKTHEHATDNCTSLKIEELQRFYCGEYITLFRFRLRRLSPDWPGGRTISDAVPVRRSLSGTGRRPAAEQRGTRGPKGPVRIRSAARGAGRGPLSPTRASPECRPATEPTKQTQISTWRPEPVRLPFISYFFVRARCASRSRPILYWQPPVKIRIPAERTPALGPPGRSLESGFQENVFYFRGFDDVPALKRMPKQVGLNHIDNSR